MSQDKVFVPQDKPTLQGNELPLKTLTSKEVSYISLVSTNRGNILGARTV